MVNSSKIITPKPGQSFKLGTTIPFSYNNTYNSALYLEPTVDILLQKEGEDYAVEIATGLSAAGENNVLDFTINLSSFAPSFEAGEYKLITVEHDTQRIVFRDGRLTIRKVTGDQTLRLTPDFGPGPVQLPPVSLEPGPVIIQNGESQ